MRQSSELLKNDLGLKIVDDNLQFVAYDAGQHNKVHPALPKIIFSILIFSILHHAETIPEAAHYMFEKLGFIKSRQSDDAAGEGRDMEDWYPSRQFQWTVPIAGFGNIIANTMFAGPADEKASWFQHIPYVMSIKSKGDYPSAQPGPDQGPLNIFSWTGKPAFQQPNVKEFISGMLFLEKPILSSLPLPPDDSRSPTPEFQQQYLSGVGWMSPRHFLHSTEIVSVQNLAPEHLSLGLQTLKNEKVLEELAPRAYLRLTVE
ncbi:hypothetical protein C8J56DRAFT_1068525 [Mycena floridula]|nr:hypothetical protein C8J56DRAFT_1068525 [Mycena floridula]